MTSDYDPAKVTMFHSTLEHTLDHFLEFWIFEGVKHFFGLLNQPPTPLITLTNTSNPPTLQAPIRGIRACAAERSVANLDWQSFSARETTSRAGRLRTLHVSFSIRRPRIPYKKGKEKEGLD